MPDTLQDELRTLFAKAMADGPIRLIADLDKFDASRQVDEFPNIFTVESMVKFVQGKL